MVELSFEERVRLVAEATAARRKVVDPFGPEDRQAVVENFAEILTRLAEINGRRWRSSLRSLSTDLEAVNIPGENEEVGVVTRMVEFMKERGVSQALAKRSVQAGVKFSYLMLASGQLTERDYNNSSDRRRSRSPVFEGRSFSTTSTGPVNQRRTTLKRPR